MTQVSCTSETTSTAMTILDDQSESHSSSICDSNAGHSLYNSNEYIHITPSLSSRDSSTTITSLPVDREPHQHQIYNYKLRNFKDYGCGSNATCEDICIEICQSLNILPTTRLLFGLRVYDNVMEWAVPGQQLRSNVRYCFRMRFKVPELDVRLRTLDPNAYEYLYSQIRSDMINEHITEIRYPAKKDNVVGLGVLDMYIDLMEKRGTAERIESNYKRYLPRPLVKAHKVFAKQKICGTFRQFRLKNVDVAKVKWNYIHEIHTLAPKYLMETYKVMVQYIPNDDMPAEICGNGVTNETCAYVKLDLYDTVEPGVKISEIDKEEKLKWVLLAKFDDIYALCTEDSKYVHFEILDLPNGYRMQFDNQIELESFVTYLAGYKRLTSRWMTDLCVQYLTPSLQELKELRCHGPIGGSYSFAKMREKREKGCISYIIRQCEKEFDTYFIDISSKVKSETFKIKKDRNHAKWILHHENTEKVFDNLTQLANYIPPESEKIFRIPPSEYDKPPLLLICLPKKLQTRKTDTELSEAEIQRKRVQIFDPKIDLRWYQKSEQECDNGKMLKMRGDWIQQGHFKDVDVSLKVLRDARNFQQFMTVAYRWSQIYSAQFIKLYGITLSTPYTMIMEHAKYGPLNEFLRKYRDKINVRCLLDVVHGLVRGIAYLQECNIIHGYIRCCNLYVKKFDPKSNLLEAKIADPGFPRPYTKVELPWIPFEHYKNLEAAKKDPNAEMWAFSTTVWEIFARGQPINNYTEQHLRTNMNRHGGILPPLSEDDCPELMYKIMMDGWNVEEPDKRFTQQNIFLHLITCKEALSKHYESVDSMAELNDASPLESDIDDGFHNSNNHINGGDEMDDHAPLIKQRRHRIQSHTFSEKNSINYFADMQSVILLPTGKLICKNKIGEGHFGSVHLGEIQYDDPNMQNEQVAIKTLKTSKTTELNDFMREIEIMQALNHPHIVKIKYCLKDPHSLIMEYFECGSFLVYLTSHKPNLTNGKLINFALDIAKGMDYLRSQKVIHRDLAARNILVDRDCVKISDFGLAQIADSNGYYIVKNERPLPIKWYALESFKTSKFSFQSDVWSYGVTLFEMFSRGENPNLDPTRELDTIEFVNRLERGERLHRHSLCPEIVYDKLMLPCWQADPKKRPTFEKIIETIQSIKNENGEHI